MRWLYFVLAAWFWMPLSQACEVIDDSGQTIRLQQPAHRIISLAPDLTELLFAAGAGKYIIGVVRGSNYPAEANQILTVASYNSLNTEVIIGLHPDLIVAWDSRNSFGQLRMLQQLGIPIYFSHQHKVTDIPGTLQRLGCLAGTEKIANQAAALFWQHYRQIQQQYSGKPVVSVFYVLWPQPLLTINQQSLISQILTLCGGKTIFTALYGTTPVVNIEAVLAADPAVMLGDKASHWQEMWYKWPQLRAVKNDHLFSVNPDWIDRAGPRLLRGADQICEYLELVRRNSSINLDNHATR